MGSVLSAPHPQRVPGRPPPIRVLLGKDVEKVVIYGRDLRKIMHEKNSQDIMSGDRGVMFNCHHSSINLDSQVLFASLASPLQPISYNQNEYKGQMHLWVNKAGRCQLVLELGLEDYVESLLPKEMNKSWPVEVLKAQAVAARTYALFKIQSSRQSSFYDLENSEKDQVNGGLRDLNEKTRKGRVETFGEVLTDRHGKIGPAYYHASCGGRTLAAALVWGDHSHGHTGRPCPCGKKKNDDWSRFISDERMLKFFNTELKNKFQSLPSIVQDRGERFSFIEFVHKGKTYKILRPRFRRHFGRNEVASNNFQLERVQNGFMLHGKGRGHGVGMCQVGALELGKTGMDYKKILAHYFPNHVIRKIY